MSRRILSHAIQSLDVTWMFLARLVVSSVLMLNMLGNVQQLAGEQQQWCLGQKFWLSRCVLMIGSYANH